MKKLLVIFISIIILILGCSEDNPTNPGDIVNEKKLKVVFYNDYCQAEGWVIVYTEDGISVIDTAKFFGNATVDFGEIAQDRITLTFITTQVSNTNKSYMIQTYYSVKKGEWKIGSQKNSVIGKIDVTTTFPNNNYDHILLSYNGSYERFGIREDTLSILHFPLLDVYSSNQNNSLSLYSSVYSINGGYGYYNWMPSASFAVNDTNKYNISLTKPLTKTQMQFNKEVSWISIDAFSSSISNRIKLFENLYDQHLTSQNILIPGDIYNMSYKISVSDYFNGTAYQYEKIFNTIPASINIPNTTVSATHNTSNNNLENITVNGSADFFTAFWFSSQNNIIYYWYVYTPYNYQSITRVEIPASITSQLSNLNPTQMDLYQLMILDNDKFTSLDDLINYYYKSTIPVTNNFNEQFKYALLF